MRAQLSARKSPTAGKQQSLLRAVSILVFKQGGRRRGQSSRSDLGGGRGGQSSHPEWKFSQRVVVKARVVRNRGVTGRATVRDHVNYIERDGVDEEGGKGRSFGADEYLTTAEVDAFVERTAEDRHHFRFIVSPEHAGEMDLPLFTRELLLQMEADLGSELDWVAVEHHNTDNPHVHVVLRGVDERGADLVIGRDYISRGLRLKAQEITTRHLGPRREAEIDQERVAELHADRATALDRAMVAEAQSADYLIDVRPPRERGVGFKERLRAEKITRLHYLESLGLADEIKPGRWQIDVGAVDKLKARARRAQLVSDLKRHAGEGYEFRDIAVYDKTAPPAPVIQGEIVGRAKLDELAERDTLLIASNAGDTAGNVYRVALSAFAEREDAPLKRGQIVEIQVYRRAPVTRADANIVAQAERDRGLYSEERHYQWTSALNRHRREPIENVDSYIEHHVKRVEAHARRGIVEALEPGVWRIPSDLTAQLQAHARTARDSGSFTIVSPVSALTLDEQIRAMGPTWLDAKLARGEHLAPLSTEALSAERRLRAALKDRALELERRGLQATARSLYAHEIETLYATEITHVAQRLTSSYGHHSPMEMVQPTGVDRVRRLEGTLAEVRELSSGPHAVIVHGKGFTLVPASPRTIERTGKQLSVTLRAAEGLDPGRPSAVQLRIRFSELERERERNLGRSR